MSEVSVLRKHLINYAKTKDVFAAYKASGYNREFYEAHRDTLALRSAAKKAFDAYKKENGSDKKLPRISELNAEYAMLLRHKPILHFRFGLAVLCMCSSVNGKIGLHGLNKCVSPSFLSQHHSIPVVFENVYVLF